MSHTQYTFICGLPSQVIVRGSVKGSHTYFGNHGLKLRAELWGLRQGLKLAKERAWEGVELENDSLNIVNIVNSEEEVENHPERILIEDCRSHKRDVNAQIWHVLGEVNRCADKMAKLGGTQREQLVLVLIPPDDVLKDLMADIMGVSYPRGR